MAKKVIKKSGKKEKFNVKKIKKSIGYATKQAYLPKKIQETVIRKTLEEIMPYLDSFDEITTAEIRDLILQKLEQMHPAVVKAWIAYEMKKIRKKKFSIL